MRELLKGKDEEIERLRGMLAGKDEEIERLRGMLEGKDVQMRAKNEVIDWLRKDLAEREAHINAVKAEVTALGKALDSQQTMLKGLTQFVEGALRPSPSSTVDLQV
jgi:chromosome segregation ATPase